MTGGQAILGVSWASISVGTIVLSLRLYTRASRKALSSDDYTIAAAFVVCVFGSIANTLQVVYGAGQHAARLPPTRVRKWAEWTLIVVFQTTVATTLVKISIGLSILRILGPTHKHLRRLVIFAQGLLVVVALAFLVGAVFSCRPLVAWWDPDVKGRCYSERAQLSASYCFGAYNVLMDLFCAGIPAFVIRDLQMSVRTKRALSVLMGLGVLTATCLIIRLATVATLYHQDAIHDSTITIIFAILEQNLGLTLASVPPLRVMLQTMTYRILGRSKTLRSLFGTHDTSAEGFEAKDLEADKTTRTTRDYYELQEVPPCR